MAINSITFGPATTDSPQGITIGTTTGYAALHELGNARVNKIPLIERLELVQVSMRSPGSQSHARPPLVRDLTERQWHDSKNPYRMLVCLLKRALGSPASSGDSSANAVGNLHRRLCLFICACLARSVSVKTMAFGGGDDGEHLDESEVRMLALAWARHIATDGKLTQVIKADLVRDIFGNPFRSAGVDPDSAERWLAWNGGTVGKLAHAIYEERRFGDLPVLADALEEAGGSREWIDHLRSPGPHVRGCWVLDALRGLPAAPV